MSEDFDEQSFSEQKRRSFLQVLFKAARLANEYSLEQIRNATGEDWIRPSHTNLFPHIPFDGIRLTDLADRLGVTKQAAQVLVDDLVQGGFLERVPDPDDGRAKLIRWSERGRQGLAHGVGFLQELEEELGAEIGDADLARTHDTLLGLIDVLERRF